MFDLAKAVEKILEEAQAMHIAVGKKVVAFEEAAPLIQLRWFKNQVQALEGQYAAKPKK